MSWDWVPARPGEEDGSDGGPSPALRRAVTVLVVVLSATFVVYYATVGLRSQAERCEIVRPDGTVQETAATWRWWPPGYECAPDDGDSSVPV